MLVIYERGFIMNNEKENAMNNTGEENVTSKVSEESNISQTEDNVQMSQNLENTENLQQTDSVQMTDNIQSSDNSQPDDTIYRYDRSYYEHNRDEHNSYKYNPSSEQQSYQSNYTYSDNNSSNTDNMYQNSNNTYSNSYTGSNYNSDASQSYQYQQSYSQTEDPKAAKKKAKKLKREQRKTKNSGRAPKVAAAVAALVAVSAVSVGSTYATLQIFGNSSSEQVVIQSTNTKDNAKTTKVSATNSSNTIVTTDVSSMVSEVMPSVVTISNVGTETYNNFFGPAGTYEYTSSGSGIIAGQSDKELLIVTNSHVISGADSINVTFVDGKEYTADVKGSDSSIDIAVIAISLEDIEEDTLNQIKVATLGDSDNLSVGEPAIAIGNAMGYGQSVTTGVISAVNREVSVDDVTNTLIQTDAAINPGNSGGALLNLAGEVIGVNSVKYASTEVEGMGYAIPISDVTDVINEMMNNETKKKVDAEDSGYLGIRSLEVNSSVSKNYNMPQGVFVSEVEKNSAADKAGIKKGDIITKIAGTSVSSPKDMSAELEYHAAGSKVEIVLQSPIEDGYGYKEKVLNVTLDRKQ